MWKRQHGARLCSAYTYKASLWFNVSLEKWREFMTDRISWFFNFTQKKILSSWDFSISRDIALTDPPISVQKSNVIENYHARQKNTKMKKGKMRKKDEEANGTWMAAKSNSMTHLHLLKLINP